MKPFLIFLLSFFITYHAPAQVVNRSARHRQIVSSLLREHNEKHMGTRTTSGISEQRVIAQSTRDGMGVIYDSVRLFYAANMGSTYDFNTMIYPYNYPYSTSPMFNYAGVFTKPQVLFDTCLHWTQDPFTLVYKLYEATTAGYDGSRNLTSFHDIFVDSVTNTNMSYINTFNAANNIDSGYWFKLHAGGADSVFKQFFTYNATGNLVEDSIYELHLSNWHMVAKSLYSYDGMENLVRIDYFANDTDTSFAQPIFEQEQFINTYDASSRLTSVLTKMHTGAALDSYVVDTFAYTAAYTYHSSWKEYQYDPINHYWAPMFYMSKAINGAGFPDTVNIKSFDSLLNAWVPQTMDIVHYNTANHPDTLHEYDYNFTSFPSTPSYNTVYYYETYINSVAVQNTPVTIGRITVFPNPATNMITIAQTGLPQGNLVSYTLTNLKGQIVRREKMPAQSETQLSVKDLLPGVYRIVIQDEAGNIVHTQSIVRQ